jgi:hypothetical protein
MTTPHTTTNLTVTIFKIVLRGGMSRKSESSAVEVKHLRFFKRNAHSEKSLSSRMTDNQSSHPTLAL